MPKYTAILVDDLPEALDVLKLDLINNCPEVEIIGTADSVVSAAKLLRQKKADILFLDIMLGDGTGFDLLEIFEKLDSKLIFTTASDEFAIKAFKFAAIDYLLKPINPDDLVTAVNRAKSQLKSNESIDLLKESIRNPNALPKKISLPAQDKISVVDIDQIVRCESDGNNTLFILAEGEKIFVTKTLKQYDQMLSDHSFIRVHQSHLVNLSYIHEYVRTEGGYLKMKNGDLVSVAVRKKPMVIDLLNNL